MARGVLLGNPKPGSANSRSTCWVVNIRHMVRGDWQRVSTGGFVVVCPSLHEAHELMLMIGGNFFQPLKFGLSANITDEQYLEWLKEHWLKLEPYRPTGKDTIVPGVDRKAREVSFALFKRGWTPSAQDILGQDLGALGKPKDGFQADHWNL